MNRPDPRSRRLPATSVQRASISFAALVITLGIALGITLTRPMDDNTRALVCPPRADLVPSCGVLLGITPPMPSPASLAAVENSLGHRFALVYSFHDINDVIPSAYDRAVSAGGALLHLSIDSRDYGAADRSTVTWPAVAHGDYDAGLISQAVGIRDLGHPVFVTFDHEPDQPTRAALGTATDFIAAWRHVHDLFAREGADNVTWVWVVTGWAGSEQTALSMWPGNAYVDWISWEAYDNRGCGAGQGATATPVGFAAAALPFYHFLRAHGPAVGIDVDKPMMISEAGSARPAEGPGDPRWFSEMGEVLRRHRQISAVTWWDHTGSNAGCDYRFSDDPTLVRAASATARNPWFDH